MLTSVMRLYHFIKVVLIASILILVGFACSSSPPPPTPQEEISVQIEVDGRIQTISIQDGNSVQTALDLAGITLAGKDRAEPALIVSLTEDAAIRVIRVEEIIETEQVIIPFQVIRQPTENLPAGQEKLLQAGKNGLTRSTVRDATTDQVRHLKGENTDLKQAVAELTLEVIKYKKSLGM